MTDTKHTPTPWTTGPNARDDDKFGIFRDGRLIAAVYIPCEFGDADEFDVTDRALADVTHIVRCVNAHDEMVAALHDMTMCFGNPRDADVDAWWEFRCDWEQGSDAIRYETLMQARAALAKVAK